MTSVESAQGEPRPAESSSEPFARSGGADRWPSGLAAALLLAAGAAVALAPIWIVVHGQWVGVHRYQHGYVLAAMAVWLAWRRWRADPPARLGPDLRYAVPLLAVLGALTVFELLYLNVPRSFLLPPLIVACVGFVFGHPAAMRMFWPAMLLYGALPVWAGINGLLQSMTTAVVSRALALAGVPAYIEGNFVRIPAGTFEIADDCSGLKYVMISTVLTLFFGLAFLRDWRRRGVLILAGALVAALCNWIRVFVIIFAGHVTNMQHYLVAREHLTFGWVLFGGVMVPVVVLARRLEVSSPPGTPRPGSGLVHGRGLIAAAIAAVVLLTLPRAASLALEHASEVHRARASASFDAVSLSTASRWQPVFVNALIRRAVVAGGRSVEVYRAEYPWQDADHRLISYRNGFVPETWQAAGQRTRSVSFGDETLAVLELEGHLDRRRRIIWAWYWVAGRPATEPLDAKLLELRGLLSGRRDAAAVAVSAECGDELDCGTARARLAQVLKDPPQLLEQR